MSKGAKKLAGTSGPSSRIGSTDTGTPSRTVTVAAPPIMPPWIRTVIR
ncbi:MAG TPA: hypothetical protein VFY65_05825 [Longimicrobium sp.]|nr:hypothetical protein [Longimicrobium sp.]